MNEENHTNEETLDASEPVEDFAELETDAPADPESDFDPVDEMEEPVEDEIDEPVPGVGFGSQGTGASVQLNDDDEIGSYDEDDLDDDDFEEEAVEVKVIAPPAPPARARSELKSDLKSFGDPDMAGDTGEDDGRAWYVVHCYSSYENKVRHNLEQRIESMGMKDKIFDVVVPVEEEIEVRDGRRRTIERRVFPGYILVYMILTEESWYVVRNTPGVTGFVGQGNTPIPLRPEEVAHIVKRMEAETPRIKVTFKSGERVRIIDGPFNDFRGTVSEIDMERAKVRVMVNFFGRETPVELDFLQVEKA